eukprot:122508-Chlamydomonas_euryale.AAC.2
MREALTAEATAASLRSPSTPRPRSHRSPTAARTRTSSAITVAARSASPTVWEAGRRPASTLQVRCREQANKPSPLHASALRLKSSRARPPARIAQRSRPAERPAARGSRASVA